MNRFVPPRCRGTALACLIVAHTAAAQVTTAQYGNARLGATTVESLLMPTNVRPEQFGRIASLAVDGPVYAQRGSPSHAFQAWITMRLPRAWHSVASQAGER